MQVGRGARQQARPPARCGWLLGRCALAGWLVIAAATLALGQQSPYTQPGIVPALPPEYPLPPRSAATPPATRPTDAAPDETRHSRSPRAPVIMPAQPPQRQRPSQRRPAEPVLAPASAPAGTDLDRLRAQLAKRGDLNLRDITLDEALFTISDIWDVSIVVGDSVQGKVNGVFKDAPLAEVLDALLLANGYSYRPVGKSLVIMKEDQVGDLNPLFESAALPCGSNDAADVAESAKLLSSPRGKVQALESNNSLLVVDYADRVAAIRKLVVDLDQASGDPEAAASDSQLQVFEYRPQYVKAEQLREPLLSVLSRDGKVTVLANENRLVALDFAPRLQLARQLLTKLDTPRTQVRITALIYDISLQDMERLGINWNSNVKTRFDANGVPQTQFKVDSIMQTPPPADAVNGAITFMNLSHNFDLTAVVNALATCKDSRLLADPNVTVMENEKAMISIVTEIPYQQLTQTQQGGNIGTTAFREAGVKLEVTPRIADDETMILTVVPSFSRLTGFTPPPTPQPILDKREVQAVVRVANLQTLVIGGLRQRRDIGEFNGVVGLKDIKGFGAFFRSRDTSVQETELIVFIRPELVTPFDQGHPREGAALGLTDALLDEVPAAAGPQPHCAPGADAGGNQPDAWVQPEELPPGTTARRAAGNARAAQAPPAGNQRTARGQPTQTDGKTAAAKPQPRAAKPAKPLTMWEKLFGSKEHPNATFVERQPVRKGFDEWYHERPAPGETAAKGGGRPTWQATARHAGPSPARAGSSTDSSDADDSAPQSARAPRRSGDPAALR